MNKVKIKRALAWTLITAMLMPNTALAGEWKAQNGEWYYQENGEQKTGWIQERGNWYFLNSDGVMMTGWYQDGRQDRYFLNRKSDGVEGMMRTGWFYDENIWYFLNTIHDGFYGKAIAGQWQWIDGYCYLFDAQGRMYANCQTPDGYTVDEEGRWTVNGIVQYVAGKGILTKQTAFGGSRTGGGSGSSGSNGGGSNSGGDEKPAVSTIIVHYIDQLTQEILKTTTLQGEVGSEIEFEHLQFEGYEICSSQPFIGTFAQTEKVVYICYLPSETSGRITIQYVNKENGEILASKEMVDEIGSLCNIQHPAIQGYKILENQITETRFTKEPQKIQLYYREKKENEAADESIVLSDNLKAIIPRTQQEIEIVEEMRNEIFDYTVEEDGTAELVVTNANPLLEYIYDGTYKINDIIYIDPCDAFSVGLVLTYYGHDDEYNLGEFDGFDPSRHEVIHGQRAGLLDILEKGTYIGYDPDIDWGEAEAEIVYQWTAGEDQRRHAAGKETKRKGRSVSTNISPLIEIDMDPIYKFKDKDDIDPETNKPRQKWKIGGSLTVPASSSNWKIDITPSFKGNLYVEEPKFDLPVIKKEPGIRLLAELQDASVNLKLKPSCKQQLDLAKLLKEISGVSYEENKVTIELACCDIVTMQGVDMKGSLILGGAGIEISWPTISKAKVEDIFRESVQVIELRPIVPFLFTLDIGGKGSIDGEFNAGIDFWLALGAEVPYENGKWSFNNLSMIAKSKEEPTKAPSVHGDFNFKIGLTGAKAALGLGTGVSLYGCVPFSAKCSSGLKLDGKIETGGKFDFSQPEDKRFQWKETPDGSPIVGTLELKSYNQLEAVFRLGYGKKDKDGNIIDETVVVHQDIMDLLKPILEKYGIDNPSEKLIVKYPLDMEGCSLAINRNTALKAVNSYGLDVSFSDDFKDYYDAKTGKIKPRLYDNDDGEYSFKCPQFIMEEIEGGKKYYEVEIISLKNTSCRELDLSKVRGLQVLTVDNAPIKNLDVSNNEKLATLQIDHCNGLETFKGNGTAFPTQWKWYSDEELTQEVHSCDKGQTIYSERYGLGNIVWNDKILSYDHTGIQHASVIAVDERGKVISDQFDGYDEKSDTVRSIQLANGNYSFQCPQFIMEEKINGEKIYYRIVGFRLTNMTNLCEILDLSKAADITSISISTAQKVKKVMVPSNNKITKVNYDPRGGGDLELDFSEFPELKELTLGSGACGETLDLAVNSNLEKLKLSQMDRNVKNILLPKKSKLEDLEIVASYGVEELDLKSQTNLTRLYLDAVRLKELSISECVKLEQENFNIAGLSFMLQTFTGNGKVFPVNENRLWNWYADPEKTELIEDQICERGITIFSDLFKLETTANLLTVLASNSDALTASGSDAEYSEALQKSRKATSSDFYYDSEDEDFDEEDFEIEIINDLVAYVTTEKERKKIV